MALRIRMILQLRSLKQKISNRNYLGDVLMGKKQSNPSPPDIPRIPPPPGPPPVITASELVKLRCENKWLRKMLVKYLTGKNRYLGTDVNGIMYVGACGSFDGEWQLDRFKREGKRWIGCVMYKTFEEFWAVIGKVE